jgi:hypothetical protein
MGIGFATVKNLMQSATDQPISDKAVNTMISYVEGVIIAKTREAADNHGKKNNLRRIQGLAPKVRIDAEAILTTVKESIGGELIGGEKENGTKHYNIDQGDRTQSSKRRDAP